MNEERLIYAHYDADGVYVYQAFKRTIIKVLKV